MSGEFLLGSTAAQGQSIPWLLLPSDLESDRRSRKMKAQIKGIKSKALPFISAPLEMGIKPSSVNKLETQKIFSSKAWKWPRTWSLLQGIKVVNFVVRRDLCLFGSIIWKWCQTLFPLNVSLKEYLLKAGWEEGASNYFSSPDISPNTAIFRQS